MKSILYISVICLLAGLNAHAQAEFVENKGQWPEQVRFKADLPAGNIWAEDHAFTFQFYDPSILKYLHPAGGVESGSPICQSHVYKLIFPESNTPFVTGSKKAKHYYNYFLGNDESKWTTQCGIFSRCDYENLFDGVDLVLYSGNNAVKYDFIVHPGSSPDKIQMQLDGANAKLDKGDLVIKTSVNEVREKAPYAYQIINGQMIEVPCHFDLNKNILKFDVEEYNPEVDLVIDPEIVFSTFIGSTASNFGFTACDDSEGNLISGAAVFAASYPTTVGAFSTNFNTTAGNYMDIAITKFNPDGTQLLYSTYIGGSGQETPHSIIADGSDNFILMGVTGSSNFPTTAGAYNQTFLGGPTLSMSTFFTSSHQQGTDFFVSKFSVAGALTASTFIGGTENDGLNYGTQLFYNYGDAFRGEINVDASDNVFVASVTRSEDFPVTANANQSTFAGGGFDGVVFKMNPSLSSLMWSTYFGGDSGDACYAVEFSNDGNLIIAGGTKSTNFPHVLNGMDMSQNGETDGFITRINAVTFNEICGTFIGTSDYDQVYFVQVDDADNVYAYGQTAGYMPITTGCYGQPNSGQFICKLSSGLNNQIWNTTIGTESSEIDISPTAFLVSDCEQIYISGWGGEVNSNYCANHPCDAIYSTTVGMPISPDAFQSTTDGSDFYLCVLKPNASDLLYASFLGGTESGEHVDGGTSRFDKNGSVYQAVCAGCQNNDDFPTTPGVWSATNESAGCNIAVFRFDLNAVQAEVAIDGPDQVCLGTSVSFINETVGASSFQWLFGDGETSTEFEPSHIFAEAGDYTIQLVGMDDALCVTSDTAEVNITILPGVDLTVEEAGLICLGEQVQLNATGSTNLHWQFNPTLSSLAIPNPIATPTTTTTYTVLDFNDCDHDTLTVTVTVSVPNTSISDNASICAGQTVELTASGGVTYLWTPALGLSNSNTATTTCSATTSTTYTVNITTADDCVVEEDVTVQVFNSLPGGNVYDPVQLCQGTSTILQADDGTSWEWSPASSLSNAFIQAPHASPADTTTYAVVITNACGEGTDFVTVNVLYPNVVASEGGTICPGDSFIATAEGGISYMWQPTNLANPYDEATTTLTPSESTWFAVTGVDENNCHDTDSLFVFVLPGTQVDAGPDQYYEYPGSTNLLGNALGLPFYWWPAEGLSCADCIYPVASPNVETWYHLSVIDDNGCVSDDSVFVKPYFPIWVPNTITPNNDGINDVFKAYGVGIEGFHLRVFDRWGLKIFESFDIDEAWTGGVSKEYYVQNDVYTWVIEYDSIDRREELVGHVTVAR